jgi:hypothetical protein
MRRARALPKEAALISHRIAVRQRRGASAGPPAPEVDVQPLRPTLYSMARVSRE